jgi:predicted phosphodiesterase
MVCCVISDIHANREALDAVLHTTATREADTVLCLGDLVGYNSEPDACVEQTLSRAAATVRGNHDKAAARLLSLGWFNPVAKKAILWTRKTARRETLQRLASLREGPIEIPGGVLICHGTPMEEDRYLMDSSAMMDSFRFLAVRHPLVRFCFHGHTHVPLIAQMVPGERRPRLLPHEEEIVLEEESTYLINPGSVGQPRDGNPRASFGILDTKRHVYRTVRVAYGLKETQRKILAAGLPGELARRLEEGW